MRASRSAKRPEDIWNSNPVPYVQPLARGTVFYRGTLGDSGVGYTVIAESGARYQVQLRRPDGATLVMSAGNLLRTYRALQLLSSVLSGLGANRLTDKMVNWCAVAPALDMDPDNATARRVYMWLVQTVGERDYWKAVSASEYSMTDGFYARYLNDMRYEELQTYYSILERIER